MLLQAEIWKICCIYSSVSPQIRHVFFYHRDLCLKTLRCVPAMCLHPIIKTCHRSLNVQVSLQGSLQKIIRIKAHCSSVVIFLVSNPVPSITAAHADLFVPVGDGAARLLLPQPVGKFQGDAHHFGSLLLRVHHDLDYCHQ